MKHLLKLPGLSLFLAVAHADTLFVENFDSATPGSTAIDGWTYLDAPAEGDHPSVGVRPSGDGKGGTSVPTADGTGNFLNGGRSAIFSARVGKMIRGTTYIVTLRARDAGSSYSSSAAYFTLAAPTGYITAEDDTLGGFASATPAPPLNGWKEYQARYKATPENDGQELYLSLQSHRNATSGVRGWDDIVVRTVPEPATYGLSAAATLAAVAAVRRRRRTGCGRAA